MTSKMNTNIIPKLGSAKPTPLSLTQFLTRYDEIDMLYPAHLNSFVNEYQVIKFVFDEDNQAHKRYKQLCEYHKIEMNVDYVKDRTYYDMMKLLQSISNKRKGEQYREIKALVPMFEKNWAHIVAKNQNKHVIHFLRLCRTLNIHINVEFNRREKFFAQMMAINTILRIPHTINNIQNASDSVSDSISRFGENLNAMNQNFSEYNNLIAVLIEHFKKYCEITTHVMIVLKLIALVYLLTQEANLNITNVACLVTLILPVDAIGKLSTIMLTSLIRAVQSIKDHFNNVAQFDNTSSVVSSFWEMLKLVTIGVLSPIDQKKYQNLTISSTKVRFIAHFLRDASTIMEYIFKLFSKLFEVFSEKIIKSYGYLPSWCREDDIDKIISEYQEIEQNKHLERCVTSIESCKIVITFYNKIQKLEAETYRALNDGTAEYIKFKVLPYLRFTIIHLRKIIDDIPPHVRNGFEGFRNKPYWIYIHGESDIGKSSSFQPVIANALAAKLKLVENFDDPHNYSYFRTCGSKYYSKYHNQPIMQYNDLFQNFSDEEKMNEAVIELTNIVDEAPYELNMADVESKGKYYCTSKIVLTNAQYDFIGQQFITNKCWSGGVHLYRRRNVVVELCAQKVYKKKVGTGIDWATVHASASTKSKYMQFVPADLYSLKFTDPITGVLIRHLSLDDGIDFILNDAYNYFNKQSNFHDQLLQSMRITFDNVAQMNPIEMVRRLISPRTSPDVVPAEEFQDAECTCKNVMRTYIARLMFMRTEHTEYTVIRTNKYLMYLIDQEIETMHEQCCIAIHDDNIKRNLALTILYNACMRTRFKCSRDYCNYVIYRACRAFKRASIAGARIMSQNLLYRLAVSFVAGFAGGYAISKMVIMGMNLTKTMMNRVTNKKHVKFAQSEEGNKRAPKIRVRRKLKALGETSGVAQYDTVNRNIEDVVKHNFATFIIRASDSKLDISSYMRAICVGGSVFIIPRHYYYVMQNMSKLLTDKQCNTELVLKWYNANETIIPWTNIDVYLPEVDYLIDVCFIRVRRLTARRDIRHFWVKENDEVEFNEAYLYGMRSKRLCSDEAAVISVDGVHLTGVQYKVEAIDVPGYGTIPESSIKSPAVYEYYNCKTIGGDCGSVLIFSNPRLNGRILAGIHVGGSVGLSTGFSAPIFQEDLDEAFEFFHKIDPVIVHQQEFSYNVAQIDVTSPMYQSLSEIGANIVGSTTFYKGHRIKAVIPRKTNIVRSCVYEYMERDFGPARTAPARLRSFRVDGEEISPFIMAYKKTLRYCPRQIPLPLYDEIIAHMNATIYTWKSKYTTDNCERIVLSDDQMINGIYGMKQLDLSTSPGFPYVFDKTGLGKRPWFDIDYVEECGFTHYKMNEELYNNVYERINLARKGVIKETYFIDTLKDEPRPLEKVLAGKTRLFQIGPMDLTLCVRKYFGCYIAHLHTTYIDGEIAVGVDANSEDWHYMFKKLMLHQYYGAGDHKEFDYSSSYQICMSFADNANDFYDDGVENALIRMVLVATCVNAYHIVDDLVIYSDQGNNSGVAITTDLNNNTNMFISRLAFKLVGLDLQKFNEHVHNKNYGDDDFKNISAEVIDKYNMLSIANVYKSFGFEYTSCNKAGINAPYMPFEECTFLKRHIVFVKPLQLYVGQLDKEVIEEIPRWSESDPNNMADQMNRFNSALIEATNYGFEYYNHLKKCYSKYIRWLNSAYNKIDATNLLSYHEIMKNKYGDRYVAQIDYQICGDVRVLFSDHQPVSTSPFLHPFRMFCDANNYSREITKFYDQLQLSADAYYVKYSSLQDLCVKKIYDQLLNDKFQESWVYEPTDTSGLSLIREYIFDYNQDDMLYELINVYEQDNVSNVVGRYHLNNVMYTKQIFVVQVMRNFTFHVKEEDERDILIYQTNDICMCCNAGFANMVTTSHHCLCNCIKQVIVDKRFELDKIPLLELQNLILRQLVIHVKDSSKRMFGQESALISNAIAAAEQLGIDVPLQEELWENVAQMDILSWRKRHDLVDSGVRLSKGVDMLGVDMAWRWVNFQSYEAYCHKPSYYFLTANKNSEIEEKELLDETVDLMSRCCFNTYRNMLNSLHQGIQQSVNQKVLERMIKYLSSFKNNENIAQADKIEITQKTTQFYEQSEVQEGDIVEHKPSMIFNPAPDVDMDNFFERPICVGNYIWPATAILGTQLFPIGSPATPLEFPSQIFMYPTFDASVVRQKMNNIFLMRPDIEITIRINTTAMHYGRLMFAIYPMHKYISKTYMAWGNASGAEWYQISANKEQSVKFVVPYRHVYDWMELTSKENGSTDSITIRNLFSLVCYVSVPLSVSIGTAQSVQVQVYARFINANLCGYTSNAMFAQSDTEVVTKTKGKTVVSDWISAAADFITCFDQIPIIGGFAKPIGYTVAKSAKLLKRFGYSVPVNVQSTTPIAFKNTLYNTCDDNPLSTKLGVSQDIAVSKDFDQVHDTPDCMTITHICQRPFLLYTGKITSSAAIGDYVWRWPVSPCNVVNTDYVNTTINDNAMYISSMAYLAFMHKMWRGSMRLTISFCSSNYHSIRCRVIWNPVNNDVELPVETDAQNCYNIVCDVNDHVDYNFTIPYMQEQHWLSRNRSNIVQTVQNCTNGIVGLQVLSKLTSISDTINPIYFQVFVSAGEDFQLAIPTNEGCTLYGVAQMDKVMSGELPSSNHITLSKSNFPSIGGVNAGIKTYNKTTSGTIESVRQLITGLTPVYRWPVVTNNILNELVLPPDDSMYSTVKFCPYGSWTFDGQNLVEVNNFYRIKPMFLFHRGSVRMSIVHDVGRESNIVRYKAKTPGARAGATYHSFRQVQYIIHASAQFEPGIIKNLDVLSFASIDDDGIFDVLSPDVGRISGFSIGGYVNENQFDITLPYNSTMHCRINGFGDPDLRRDYKDQEHVFITMPTFVIENAIHRIGLDLTTEVEAITTALVTIGGTDYNVPWIKRPIKYMAFVAAGDDYIMGVQLPIPMIKRRAPAAVVQVESAEPKSEPSKELVIEEPTIEREKRALPELEEILRDLESDDE